LGGIAGDMFIAAVLDAWPELTDGLVDAIRAGGLPADWTAGIVEHRDHILSGKRFAVAGPGHDADAGADHVRHVHYREIVSALRRAPLAARVCERALAIMDLLAQAEAEVHGVSVDEVTFHEVGGWDSIADIVGAAFALETLAPASWSVGPIPLGGGRVSTAHGAMPIPAPATAVLLKGFTLIDDGIRSERVTPTGAAILGYLRQVLGPPAQFTLRPMKLDRSGTGFGTRVLPGISNVLRILAFDASSAIGADEQIGELHFEIDDQTAEDLAIGIENLRNLDGVLDVLQVPAVGKKGRMVTHVQVLCLRQALRQVIDACFIETTTIGIRWTATTRAVLERTVTAVETDGRSMAVKIATRPGGQQTVKADSNGTQGPGGHVARQQRRSLAETQVIQKRIPEDS
jgi:uncharacterized protein (TIGR00299 family) protein